MGAIRVTVGVVARVVFWVALALIVVDALLELWQRGNEPLAVAAAAFFPVTVFVWPLAETGAAVFGLTCWWLLIVCIVAYPISTFVGGLALARQFAATYRRVNAVLIAVLTIAVSLVGDAVARTLGRSTVGDTR